MDGKAHIIHSGEGVTHGDPLDMVAYGIGILLLIKSLKSVYPDITQPYYSDDDGELGMFDHLKKYFKALKCNGPAQGYFLYPNKIILSVNLQNPEAGEIFGHIHIFKVCMGTRYLGGYIEDDKSKGDWIK